MNADSHMDPDKYQQAWQAQAFLARARSMPAYCSKKYSDPNEISER